MATSTMSQACENHIYHHKPCSVTCSEQTCPLTQPDTAAQRKADVDALLSTAQMYADRASWCQRNRHPIAAQKWARLAQTWRERAGQIERGEVAVTELPKCPSCDRPMFRSGTFPAGELLPKGLTMGNRLMVVFVHGQRLEVCSNCRYDKYGAW